MAEKVPFQRKRQTSQWEEYTIFSSPKQFLDSGPPSGLSTIIVGSRRIDILVVNRHSPTTLVTFHGDLSIRQKTIPYMTGTGLSFESSVNLIALSDPSLEMGAISISWFLGDREIGPLRPLLAPLIRHVLACLASKRTILFGASGGGYAAVKYGQEFDDCVVLAMNPRLNLDAHPIADMTGYLKACHNANTATPVRRVRSTFFEADASETLDSELNFDLLVLQNHNDVRYLNGQALPFLERNQGRDRLYMRLFDGPDGHKPVPKEDLKTMLISLADTTEGQADAILSAKFQPVRKELLELHYGSVKHG